MRSAVIASSCCKPYDSLSYWGRIPESSLDCSWTIGPKTWLLLWWSALSLIYSNEVAAKASLQFNGNGSRYFVFACVCSQSEPAYYVDPQLSSPFRFMLQTGFWQGPYRRLPRGRCQEAGYRLMSHCRCQVCLCRPTKVFQLSARRCSSIPILTLESCNPDQHTSSVEHVFTHSRKCAKFKALFTPPYRWDTQNELLMTHILLYPFFLLHVMSESYFRK